MYAFSKKKRSLIYNLIDEKELIHMHVVTSDPSLRNSKFNNDNYEVEELTLQNIHLNWIVNSFL